MPSERTPVSSSIVIGWRVLSIAVNSSRRASSSRTGRPAACGSVRFEVEIAFAAEAAAQRRHDHPHVRLCKPECSGDARARGEGCLCRAPDRDPPSVPLRESPVRLDRDGMGHVRLVALRDDQVGLGQSLLNVALHLRHDAAVVPAAHDPRLCFVRLPERMDKRCALAQRLVRVEDGLERLVVDPDQPASLLGRFGRECRYRGDDLALEADDVTCQERPVADESAVADVGHVLLG